MTLKENRPRDSQVQDSSPVVRGIDISPSNPAVTLGGSLSFRANVWGDNISDPGVIWFVEGASNGSTNIDTNGTLRVAPNENAQSVVVKAVPIADRNKSSSVRVNITRNKYTVSVRAVPQEGGNVSGGATVDDNARVTLVAAPNNGWRFRNWEFNGRRVDAGNVYDLTNIKENVNAVAVFERGTVKIKVASENEDYGYVEGGGEVVPGSSMTIRAKARSGYTFSHWERDGKDYSKDEKLRLENIDRDCKYVAFFDREVYNVKVAVSPDRAGSIQGAGDYKRGKNVDLVATPSQDYKFVSWMRDGKVISTGSSLYIDNISKDLSFTAVFEHKQVAPKNWTIEGATTDANGVITPAGKMQLQEGSGLTYTITPKAGYAIKQVAVDGVAVGPVSSYTFTNVRENHAIVAAFEKLPVIFGPTGGEDKKANTKPAQQNQSKPAQQSQGNKQQEPPQQAPADTAEKPQAEQQIEQPDTNKTNVTQYDIKMDEQYAEHITEAPELEDIESHPSSSDMAELSVLNGAMQQLDIDPDRARVLIKGDNDDVLMNAAILNDDMTLVVHNSFEHKVNTNETDTQLSSLDNKTFKDFPRAVKYMLNEDEKLAVYSGERVSISLNIISQGGRKDTSEQKEISKKLPAGTSAQEFFEVNLLKIAKGEVVNLTELMKPIEITIDVPEKLMGDYDYLIARNHNGQVDMLEDLDDNPNTITFRTDRFSTYAIVTDGTTGILIFVLTGVAALVIIVIVAAVVMSTKKKRRRA